MRAENGQGRAVAEHNQTWRQDHVGRLGGDRALIDAEVNSTVDPSGTIEPRAHDGGVGPVDQAERVVLVVRDVLADNVIGIYLYGSSVLGGLHPTSDLDILVVTREPMTADKKRGLIGRLLPISGRGRSDRRVAVDRARSRRPVRCHAMAIPAKTGVPIRRLVASGVRARRTALGVAQLGSGSPAHDGPAGRPRAVRPASS